LQPLTPGTRKIGRAENLTPTESYLGHPSKAFKCRRTGDLALFDLAIDSKLRACDLTTLRVRDTIHGEHVSSRAMVMQQKTQRPAQFEITEQHGRTSFGLTLWKPLCAENELS